jgi:endonuclease/exonuclease/phosphatase (EEP) superfamily protein YafD
MILALLTSAIAFLTIFGYLKWLWWFTLLDFFRLQYAFLAFILLVFSLYFGNYIVAAANVILICVNIYRIRHFFPHLPHKPVQDAHKTIFSVNAYKENSDPEDLGEILDKTDPQILLVMEMTENLEKKLAHRFARFAYRLQTPVRDGFSICLLCKTPLENTKITYHGPTDTPLLHAQADINGKTYQIYSAHPKPALNKKWSKDRRAYFGEIEDIIGSENHHPVIVMGDFNSVPWESHFVEFLKRSKLKSTIKDQGYKVTWPVYFPLMGIPMDHILISQEEEFSNAQVGPYVGSDHYPLSINL